VNFYNFLWEAVRRPSLIVEYAKAVGVELPNPPEDFYARLEYVAKAAVLVLEAERGEDEFWLSRCREVKKFYLEAQADLRERKNLPSFTIC